MGTRKQPVWRLDLNEMPWVKNPDFYYTRQPDYNLTRLHLANYAGVKPEQVVITNGSYHALDIIFTFLFKDADKILMPVPTFPFYPKFSLASKLNIQKLIYHQKFSVEEIIKHTSKQIRGIYIANPNNPIGYSFSVTSLAKLIKLAHKRKILVVVDEAYFEFSGITVKNLIKTCDNLIIVRTLSKAFGLAGMRAGYIITNQHLAQKIEEFRGPPYIVNHLMLKTVSRKLRRLALMKKQVSSTSKIKIQLEKFLKTRKINYFPSQTNFLTIQTKNPKLVAEKLEQKHILVKNLDNYPDGGEILKNCIRMTIPPKLNPLFLEALDEVFGGR